LRRLTVLVDDRQDTGYHAIECNGRALPSGITFFELRAG
jgi:hypothetical protein